MCVSDHVAKCAEIVFMQHALDRREYAGDFLAASNDLFVRQSIGIFRFTDPRNGDLAPLKLMHISSVFLRVDQIILAAPHETQEIMEKLADIGCAHEVVQAQVADTLPQIDPQILVIEHAELFTAPAQELIAIFMEGGDLQTGYIYAA